MESSVCVNRPGGPMKREAASEGDVGPASHKVQKLQIITVDELFERHPIDLPGMIDPPEAVSTTPAFQQPKRGRKKIEGQAEMLLPIAGNQSYGKRRANRSIRVIDIEVTRADSKEKDQITSFASPFDAGEWYTPTVLLRALLTTCRPRAGKTTCAIMGRMTEDQVKAILDRVLTWRPERRADVAHVVELMEEQNNTDLHLSEEQAAEVRRRLADPSRKTIPAEQVFKRFRSSSA